MKPNLLNEYGFENIKIIPEDADFPLEIYENSVDNKIFIRETPPDTHNFVSVVPIWYFTTKTIQNMLKIVESPIKYNLKLIDFQIKEENIHLGFEYAGISLKNYLCTTNADIELRQRIFNQLISFLLHCEKFEIELPHADLRYFFIENLEQPVLKIFNHCIIYV